MMQKNTIWMYSVRTIGRSFPTFWEKGEGGIGLRGINGIFWVKNDMPATLYTFAGNIPYCFHYNIQFYSKDWSPRHKATTENVAPHKGGKSRKLLHLELSGAFFYLDSFVVKGRNSIGTKFELLKLNHCFFWREPHSPFFSSTTLVYLLKFERVSFFANMKTKNISHSHKVLHTSVPSCLAILSIVIAK